MLKKKFGAGAGADRSWAFIGGAGAKIFDLELETKKKYLEPEPRKMSQLSNTGFYRDDFSF